jgi:hypothetical protein
MVGEGGGFHLLMVLGLVAGPVIAIRPMLGLYACFVLLILLPYRSFRVDVPVLHSALQLVALLTLCGALGRALVRGVAPPVSRMYIPLSLCVLVFALNAVAGHGPAAAERLARFAQDLWPIVLVPALVRDRRQARSVLIAMLGTLVALALLWLPGLVSLGARGSASSARAVAAGGPAAPTFSASLLGVSGAFSYETLVAMALVVPVLLGLAIGLTGWSRAAVMAGGAILGGTILLSTYASAVLALGIGAAALLVVASFGLRSGRVNTSVKGFIAMLCTVLVLSLLTLLLPVAQHALTRITHAATDVSGSLRLEAFDQGFHAWLASPLVGWGAYDTFAFVPGGWALAGHDGFIVMAYEFGLLLLVPFLWLLAELLGEYVRLVRASTAAVDRCLATGILASLLTAVAVALFDPVFGDVTQDTVIWTLAGLVIARRAWKLDAPVGAPPR